MPKVTAGSSVRRLSESTDGEAPVVKSITRAVCVLNCLDEGLNTITDIAAVCNLSKSTVHRLLRALEESALVIQEPRDHRYYLGPLITKLVTNPLISHTDLITCSLLEMQHLVDVLGETVDICVMPALSAVIIHEIPSTFDLRVTEENWKMGFRYAGAAIKALLSQLTDNQLRIANKYITLTQLTPLTITGRDAFLKDIRMVRRQGYSLSYGEKIPGAFGIAAPLHHYVYPAALGIIGPEERIRPRLDEFISRIKECADRISENIRNSLPINH